MPAMRMPNPLKPCKRACALSCRCDGASFAAHDLPTVSFAAENPPYTTINAKATDVSSVRARPA